MVLLGGTKVQIFKRLDGTFTALGNPAALPLAMTPKRSYMVRLSMTGSTIEMHVDGRLLGSVEDSSIAAGAAGLVTHQTNASFESITVYQ